MPHEEKIPFVSDLAPTFTSVKSLCSDIRPEYAQAHIAPVATTYTKDFRQ
jgi:hypothetical protein